METRVPYSLVSRSQYVHCSPLNGFFTSKAHRRLPEKSCPTFVTNVENRGLYISHLPQAIAREGFPQSLFSAASFRIKVLTGMMGDKLTLSSEQETQLTYGKACWNILGEVILNALFFCSVFLPCYSQKDCFLNKGASYQMDQTPKT